MRSASLIVALMLVRTWWQVQPPVFRTGVEAVLVDVSVMRHGQPVAGLTARDFLVTDNGAPQQIALVTLEQMPLSVLLVLDSSGSMVGGKLSDLVDAGRALVASLRQSDRVAVVGFSQAITVELPLTTDQQRIYAALESLHASGATALRDALYTALQFRPTDDGRPLVLLFSDGVDNASWLTETETLDAVRHAGVTIHAVGISEGPVAIVTDAPAHITRPSGAQPRFLEQVANAAGGRHWVGKSSRDLRVLFSRALDEMRARYLLSFYPQGLRREGWHQLHVALRTASGEVKARPGYFVSSTPP
jgi:VWFA-related protein